MSLLQMSIAGAALIVAVAVIRALALHKLPKWFLVVLWGIVLLRLLVPFSVPSPIGLYGLGWDHSVPGPVPVHHSVDFAETASPEVQSVIQEDESLPGSAIPFAIDLWTAVWLAGAIACGAVFAGLSYQCRRKFREALPVEEAHRAYIDRWLGSFIMARTVVVRQSDRIAAPLTYGLWKPVILLPKSTDWEDTEALDYVLAHELAHIRRWDGLWKFLMLLALCVHWFNPLVWVMYVLLNRDIELACDEAVLRKLGNRGGYAMTLIRMEERKIGFPALGSHFSKNAIEERITAIMKMQKKSVIALIIALVLMSGTVSVFAASAPLAGHSSEGEATVLSRGDGSETYYSRDNGETWKLMAQDEFDQEVSGVEWWTAEEYAAWLEEEKIQLQSIIGSKSWTPSTGWFTWTQERVDETIAEYEEILEEIWNGKKVSKPIYDMDGGVLMYAGDYDVFEDESEDAAVLFADGCDYQKLFAEYKRYGLIVDNDAGNLYWDGQRVRIFVDGAEYGQGFASVYEHYDPDGQIDLHTVRERVDNGDGSYSLMGPLVKIEEFEPELMFLDALECQRYIDRESRYGAERTAEDLERYTPFGLTYEIDLKSETVGLTMEWNGQRVRSLFDAQRQLMFANSLGRHGIDIEAIYENGRLTGLKIAEDSDREFLETGVVIDSESTTAGGAGCVSGETIAERMEKYAPYGVTYEESGGKQIIRYNGKSVKSFADSQPNGSVFSVQSTDGGEINVETVYSNGKLTGVKIAE